MNMAKKRPNIIPIIEDARHPQKYRMLVPMVDVVFAGDPCVLALARVWRKTHLPAAAQQAHAFSTNLPATSACNGGNGACLTR